MNKNIFKTFGNTKKCKKIKKRDVRKIKKNKIKMRVKSNKKI